MTPNDTPSPLTPAVFHVLLALADDPLHGYAIMKRVEQDSGLGMGPGTIYGSLDRLRDAGWVSEGSNADSISGKDARRGRSFALTALGRDALRSEARRLARLARLAELREVGSESTATS